MSKYSHYEMCEKIFGQRYKWNEQKQDYELYSRTDMWNKLIEQQDKIAELKQQLAEKDKEIEKILKENEKLVIKHNVYNYGDKIQQDKVYSITGEALELLINRPNKKAIEQLEKVKEKLLEELQNVTDLLDPLEYEDYHELIGCGRGYKNSIEEIDNQINELKGE